MPRKSKLSATDLPPVPKDNPPVPEDTAPPLPFVPRKVHFYVKERLAQKPKLGEGTEQGEGGVSIPVPAVKVSTDHLRLEIPRKEVEVARPSRPAVVVTTMREPFQYGIMGHSANPEYTYLVALKASKIGGGIVVTPGCFVNYLYDMFCLEFPVSLDAIAPMPCIELTPAPKNIKVSAPHWWKTAVQFPSPGQQSVGEVKCFPAPKEGFKVGDYISFRGRPQTYGWVSAVIYRDTGKLRLYLVCAITENDKPRLMMVTNDQVSGPEFTFVPPENPFWSKKNFPLVHSKYPDHFGYFEPPSKGFELGDPVTVFTVGNKVPIDGKIEAVTRTKWEHVSEYNVRLPDGNVVVYQERDVLGPRVDRFNPDLNPAHLTPDQGLVDEVEKQEFLEGVLRCDEDFQQAIRPPAGIRPPSPYSPDIFVTPPLGPMVRTRRGHGWTVDIPRPGALINRVAARIRDGA